MKRKWAIVATGIGLIAVVVIGLLMAFGDRLNVIRTLASLRKVDDYPLYMMTYYGDYGFDELLGIDDRRESGSRSGVGERLAPDVGWACTTFAAFGEEESALLGRNFDWIHRASLLLFTDPPDGYASVSLVDLAYFGIGEQEPSWAGRAALLGAPYMPFDGMNEAGLAVGMMAISRSRFDGDPQKTTIGSLQVIRLILDYAADVDEALALMGNYNVDFGGGPPIHYLIADVSGNSAVVEFIDDEMRVLRNEGPWQISTNFIISEERPEGADSSCWRYNAAYETLKQVAGDVSPEEAMAILGDVSQSNTIWSVVYDMVEGDVGIVVGREYDDVHEFKLRMSER
jgi:hypothetical protein